MTEKSDDQTYTVYIVECADGTYYTGIAKDVATRIKEHNEGKLGAKYTKARRPVRLVYSEAAPDRSVAQQREYVLRKLPRTKKENLISKQ